MSCKKFNSQNFASNFSKHTTNIFVAYRLPFKKSSKVSKTELSNFIRDGIGNGLVARFKPTWGFLSTAPKTTQYTSCINSSSCYSTYLVRVVKGMKTNLKMTRVGVPQGSLYSKGEPQNFRVILVFLKRTLWLKGKVINSLTVQISLLVNCHVAQLSSLNRPDCFGLASGSTCDVTAYIRGRWTLMGNCLHCGPTGDTWSGPCSSWHSCSFGDWHLLELRTRLKLVLHCNVGCTVSKLCRLVAFFREVVVTD